MPRPKATKTPTDDFHSPEIAKNVKIFRIQFVDPGQLEAAKKLKISQGLLSQIENGRRPLNAKLLEKLVKEYHLNSKWLVSGKGEKRTDMNLQPSARLSLQALYDEIEVLKQAIQIFEVNLTHAFKIIEQQGKFIEILRNNNSN